jgi:hypothetical protein
MMVTALIPEYVKHIPKELEPGILYISKEFEIAIHLCACGCGVKAVTPLKQWKLTDIDGNVTLRPSIGNFAGEHPYHAHYFVTNSQIQWV